MRTALIAISLMVLPIPSFAFGDSRAGSSDTYTLYRSSATTNGSEMRIHIATFDASDGMTYNRGNCEIARDLFLNQPGVTVSYWCERGFYQSK